LNHKIIEPFVAVPPWESNGGRLTESERRYYLSQAYRASGWQDRALKEIDEALRLDPRNAEYHLLRAYILIGAENPQEAFLAAMKALDYGPEKAKGILALTGEFYLPQGSTIYSRILKSHPGELLPYLGLVNIALYQRNLSEAEKRVGQASRMEPQHPAVLFTRGKIELAKGNHGDGVRLLEASKEKGEDSADVYGLLGDAYSRLGQSEKAADAYQAALARRRRHTGWRLSWAMALEKLERRQQAEEKYREVLALDPSEVDAWKGLRRLKKTD
jgi:tetratricopeptide (TPR) repeat protein